nr:Lycopene cyclase protein [uncultured bacterium]
MGFDVIFVGGGLSAALCTLALLDAKPGTKIAIIERTDQLGRDHTWCFHASDVAPHLQALVEPLVSHRWSGYRVSFPHRERQLASSYTCITGAQLHRVVSARVADAPGCALLLGRSVGALSREQVTLDDGTQLNAKLVIDARGPIPSAYGSECGYQKFVGLELMVDPDHTLREPILMDAKVPQIDGLRFMYVLPFAADRVLVEDTYFSDNPYLHAQLSREAILRYAQQLGLRVREVVREERGVLPMPWRCEPPTINERGPLRAGYAGSWFHPVTGYSFPFALRFAEALSRVSLADHTLDLTPLKQLASTHAGQLPFLLSLTRTMFSWFEPSHRYAVLEHFYRLPEPLIERFYAATLTPLDRARMFLGPPPRGLSMRRMFAGRPEVSP